MMYFISHPSSHMPQMTSTNLLGVQGPPLQMREEKGDKPMLSALRGGHSGLWRAACWMDQVKDERPH